MRLSIRHELRFAIPPGTTHAVQHLLLTPIDTPAQKVIEWEILVPGIEDAALFFDAYGNCARSVSQTRPPAGPLFVTVTGVVQTTDTAGVLGRLPRDPIPALFKRTTPLTRPNGSLVNRLRAQQRGGLGTLALMHWLMGTLHEAEAPARAQQQAALEESGEDSPLALDIVAEDHAHVFVAAARGMDLPARFVTGYVLDPERIPRHLHAWAEVHIDDTLGWVGFDASANLCPTEAYVRLAAGLDAESTTPIRRVPDYAPDGPERLEITEISAQAQTQEQT